MASMARRLCAVCGHPEHASVHQPVIQGPRLGQPWDHAYQDADVWPSQARALQARFRRDRENKRLLGLP